jgi:type II secretory pathway pseudopilin PulG
MAALLVALAVMAVLMSVALPVWRQQAQREKEEELVFRGQQYMRAVRLYQARTQTMPGSVDLLVTGRFIRKKYKDPITNDDFELIGQGGIPGQAGQQAAPSTGRGPTGQPGRVGPGSPRRAAAAPFRRPAASARVPAADSGAPSLAGSWASGARARTNRFASIRGATITTSGCSSWRNRRPAADRSAGNPVGDRSAVSPGVGSRNGDRPRRRRGRSNSASIAI